MPEITIISPAFNHEKYIAEAIESVLNQTFQDFEYIITDDGSSDRTPDIIKTYNDPRIKFFQFDQNQGVINASLNSFRHATGKYVTYLTTDDAYLPHKLQAQYDYLEAHPEVGAVFSLAQIVNEEGNIFAGEDHFYYDVFRQPNRSRQEWLKYFFFEGNCLCAPSEMIRRSILDDLGYFDQRLANLADFEYWVRLCLKHEIHILQEPLLKFRVRNHEMNASGDNPTTRIRSAWEYFLLLKHYLSINSFEELQAIFPEADIPVRDLDLIPFYVAQQALKLPRPYLNAFALETLYDLLGCPIIGKKLEELNLFSPSDYVRLTAVTDVFQIETVHQLHVKQHALLDTRQQLETALSQAQHTQQSAGMAEESARYRKLKKSTIGRILRAFVKY